MKSWRNNSHFIDCIFNGRIPDSIPDHYVRWAKGMAGLRTNQPLVPMVIRLGRVK